jgi:hypothetical protein
MNSKMRICLSSPPDREKLVAEFFFDEEQWAELNQEGESLILEIYPRRSGEPWLINFEEMLETLKEGKQKLVG